MALNDKKLLSFIALMCAGNETRISFYIKNAQLILTENMDDPVKNKWA